MFYESLETEMNHLSHSYQNFINWSLRLVSWHKSFIHSTVVTYQSYTINSIRLRNDWLQEETSQSQSATEKITPWTSRDFNSLSILSRKAYIFHSYKWDLHWLQVAVSLRNYEHTLFIKKASFRIGSFIDCLEFL